MRGVSTSQCPARKRIDAAAGACFNAVSDKALAVAKANPTSRSYWDWHDIIQQNKNGGWPYTPATNLLYGLKEALAMLNEEGLDNVFDRHLKLAAATRAAVRAWNLEILCQNPEEYSPILTAVMMPAGHDADHFRDVVLKNFDMSLGAGLSKVEGPSIPDRAFGPF